MQLEYVIKLARLVMPQSGSEPRFGPEPFRTGPKSGPRFSIAPELNWKSGSRFGRGPNVVNPVRTEPDPKPEGTVLTAATKFRDPQAMRVCE